MEVKTKMKMKTKMKTEMKMEMKMKRETKVGGGAVCVAGCPVSGCSVMIAKAGVCLTQ